MLSEMVNTLRSIPNHMKLIVTRFIKIYIMKSEMLKLVNTFSSNDLRLKCDFFNPTSSSFCEVGHLYDLVDHKGTSIYNLEQKPNV